MCSRRGGEGRRAAPLPAALLALPALIGCTDILAHPPLPDGTIVWQVAGEGRGVPSQDAQTLFAMTKSHELLAIDKATGRVRWRSKSGFRDGDTRGWGTAIAGDVVVMSDRNIYAFDRVSGAARWTFAPAEGFPGYSLVTSDSSSVYVGSASRGWVWALSAATGAVRWSRQLDTAHRATAWDPVVHDGVVYVGLERFAQPRTGGVFALDAATGVVLWRREFTPSGPNRGAGGTGPVAIVGDLVVVAANDGTIWALARRDGTVRWKAPQPAGLMTNDDIRPLTVIGNVLVAASSNEEIAGYDAETGRPLWIARPRELGSVWGWLSSDGVDVYAQGSGHMSRIDRTGRILWTRGDLYGTPCFQQGAVVDAGRVYSSGCEAIYAMRK